jgi:hypothetical protein
LDLKNGEVKDVKIEYGTCKRTFRKDGSINKEDILWLNGKKPTITQIRGFINPFDAEELIIQLHHEGQWKVITPISGYLCTYEIGGCSLLVKFFDFAFD